MCQFCAQHGDGKKWYLQAENYSEDLLSDLRRRDFIRDFFGNPEQIGEGLQMMAKLSRAPGFVQRVIKGAVTRRMKKQHFGQVLPLEDIKEIFGFVNSIVRVACICRRETIGRDVGYCYGISMGPGGGRMTGIIEDVDPSFLHGPDTSEFDELTVDEATAAFEEHEKEGLSHSVWTFMAPFIGGICNCDRLSCLAMQATVVHDTKVMWRAEYVAEIAPDLCTGCRSCMRACQFGAMSFNPADRKVEVDLTACYGCGVCRAACPNDAIALKERSEVPAAAGVW